MTEEGEAIEITLRAEPGQGGEYFGLHLGQELTFDLPEPVRSQVFAIKRAEDKDDSDDKGE